MSTYIMFKIYFLIKKLKYFSFNKMTNENRVCEAGESVSITYPEIPTTMSEVDNYRNRLIHAHVKTEDDINNMTPNEIKKEYLKHEQDIINKMSNHVSKVLVKTYTNSVCSVLPIDDQEGLEKDLNNDVFVKAAVSEYLPPLYYKYGALLAPLTVLSTTATHINYKQIFESGASRALREKINQYKNGRNKTIERTTGAQEESTESDPLGEDNHEEGDTCEQRIE